jgi:hypothetical protein
MNARPELMATDQSVNVSTSASSEIIYIDGEEFKHRLHEAVGAEIEAAVEAVVHEVLEAELGAVQESVAEVGCRAKKLTDEELYEGEELPITFLSLFLCSLRRLDKHWILVQLNLILKLI